jgi:hypothetical protein
MRVSDKGINLTYVGLSDPPPAWGDVLIGDYIAEVQLPQGDVARVLAVEPTSKRFSDAVDAALDDRSHADPHTGLTLRAQKESIRYYRIMPDDISALSGNIREFAEVCVRKHTSIELIAAMLGDADATEMSEWRITAEQWRMAVWVAYIKKKQQEREWKGA